MNPKLIMLSAMSLGIIGAAAGTAGQFDGKLHYCLPVESGCEQRSIPDWMKPPTSALNVRRTPGAAGWKLCGAFLAVAGFGVSMSLARSLAQAESRQQSYQSIWLGLNLQKLKVQAQAELEAFNQQVMIQAAEQSYAALAPYQEPLEAEVVSDASAPLDSQAQATTTNGTEQVSTESSQPAPNQTGEVSPSSTHQPTASKNDELALKILDTIVGSNRSTVIAAATGTGKSVSESYILTKFFKRFPVAEVWVISQKNDSFNGLDKKGRVLLFDVLQPEEAFKAIDAVWEIFDKRRRVRESDRIGFKNQPVRLILADWHSVYDACRNEKWFEPYLKKLSTIVTVGRELNVCLIVDTQSFNISALGLATDTNIRHNLNILSQGFTWVDSEGITQGDYGVLENIISSHHILKEAELRQSLKEQFKALKEESQRLQLPIAFTSVEPPRLAILPDIRHYKPGQESRVKLEGYTPEQLNRILALEFEIDPPTSTEQSSADVEVIPDNAQAKQILKSWFVGKGWVKISSARSICKPLRSCTKDSDEVRSLINELVREELVIVNESDEFNVDVTS